MKLNDSPTADRAELPEVDGGPSALINYRQPVIIYGSNLQQWQLQVPSCTQESDRVGGLWRRDGKVTKEPPAV